MRHSRTSDATPVPASGISAPCGADTHQNLNLAPATGIRKEHLGPDLRCGYDGEMFRRTQVAWYITWSILAVCDVPYLCMCMCM